MSSTREVDQLKDGEWFISGGNGFIQLYERGNAEPIARFRANYVELPQVQAIATQHNTTLRQREREVRAEGMVAD